MVKTTFYKDELEIPEGVEVSLEGNHHIKVKGPNGEITKDFSHIRGIKVSLDDRKLIFSTHFPKSGTLALAKTIFNLIKNLIVGVQTNYQYVCKVCYSHFPCNVEVKPEKIQIKIKLKFIFNK